MNILAMKAGLMEVAPRIYTTVKGDRIEFVDNRTAIINGERFTGQAMNIKIQEIRHN